MIISILDFYKVALHRNISSSLQHYSVKQSHTILLHQQAMIWVGCFRFFFLNYYGPCFCEHLACSKFLALPLSE